MDGASRLEEQLEEWEDRWVDDERVTDADGGKRRDWGEDVVLLHVSIPSTAHQHQQAAVASAPGS